MRDLKARKLARLPGDKCRREEDSHAGIGVVFSPSSFFALQAPSEAADRSLPPARVPCISHTYTRASRLRARLLTYREEMPHTRICVRVHARMHSLESHSS